MWAVRRRPDAVVAGMSILRPSELRGSRTRLARYLTASVVSGLEEALEQLAVRGREVGVYEEVRSIRAWYRLPPDRSLKRADIGFPVSLRATLCCSSLVSMGAYTAH